MSDAAGLGMSGLEPSCRSTTSMSAARALGDLTPDPARVTTSVATSNRFAAFLAGVQLVKLLLSAETDGTSARSTMALALLRSGVHLV